MGEEKRAHERQVVRFPVRVRLDEGAELTGRVENLGALGAFVLTDDLEQPIEVGDHVTLSIQVPDRNPFDVAGQVLRVDQEFAEGQIRRSFAVRFAHEVDV